MKWNENTELWIKIDNLMKNCKDDLTEMLGELYKHQQEIGLLGEAVMFGGLGKLVLMYNQFRTENELILFGLRICSELVLIRMHRNQVQEL